MIKKYDKASHGLIEAVMKEEKLFKFKKKTINC